MRWIVLALAVLAWSSGEQASSAATGTAQYFDAIKNNPPMLLAFLRGMPKGGDRAQAGGDPESAARA